MGSDQKLKENKCECKDSSEYYVHPSALERWANEHRHLWIDSPGTNDYFIHKLAKDYYGRSENAKPPNPPYPFKSLMPIPRAYCYDYELINIRRKVNGLKTIEDTWYRPTVSKMVLMKKELLKKKPCEPLPPFWWGGVETKSKWIDPCEKVVLNDKEEKKEGKKRWSKVLDITGTERSLCQRTYEMKRVGQPFKHEAISFYNKHFPTKLIKLTPVKFSK